MSRVLTGPDDGRYLGMDVDQLLRAYRLMAMSRSLDDKQIKLRNQNQVFFQLSCAGHEAILVAAAMAMRPGYDWFYPYYRDQALCLALGASPYDILLQCIGSSEDPGGKGRQYPYHWGYTDLHIVSGSACTTTQCTQAVGCSEASLLFRGMARDVAVAKVHDDEVTYVSLGDGATSGGEFWEALNAACLRKLPLVCLVEDNEYAISSPVEVHTAGGDISALVRGFPSLNVVNVDGTDFLESYRAMNDAVAYARARRGPSLVHAKVIRAYSHSLSDDDKLYRPVEEREADARRDPLRRFADFLITNGLSTAECLGALRAEVDLEVADAATRAIAATRPDPATAALYVYSPDVDPASTVFETQPLQHGAPETMVTAITRTLKDEMARNQRIVVFGQDVADVSRSAVLETLEGKGGVFKVTHGLQRAFGSERVFSTPLAEGSIIGRAVGMATRGLKPVVEIQFFDYIWPAMIQIRNELSMLRYRSGNRFSCAVVIRVPIGGYLRGGGPYHSQSGESIFAHCPGIRIVMPSNAVDASGLLRTALRCDDPVLFLEHKHLYRQTYNKGIYPGPDYTLPFARAAELRHGTDLVIITWGGLVRRTLLAVDEVEREGVRATVLDLRTIAPYDWQSIAKWVKATSRVLVAHEDQITCGFGAEIAARIAGELIEHLDAPVVRVGALDTPVAYAPELEEAILPQSGDIVDAIRALAAY